MSESTEEKVVKLPNSEAKQLKSSIARVLQYSRPDTEEADGQVEGELVEMSLDTTEPAAQGELVAESEHHGAVLRMIAVEEVVVNPFQPREYFDEAAIDELARSIKVRGVLQPLLVRPLIGEQSGPARFQLIAGERRLRAAKLVGLSAIPAIVQDLEDIDAVELSIIENVQREDLNAIEEALGYQTLNRKFKMKQAEIAEAVGKSKAAISNSLRLLQLELEVIELLKSGELSAGHGRALLQLSDPELQVDAARKAASKALSVRALETLVSRLNDDEVEAYEEDDEREKARLIRQADKVSDLLNNDSVRLSRDSEGRKKIQITFESEAAWRRFMSLLRG